MSTTQDQLQHPELNTVEYVTLDYFNITRTKKVETIVTILVFLIFNQTGNDPKMIETMLWSCKFAINDEIGEIIFITC